MISPTRNVWRVLDQFKMREDRNGVATKGLLYMETSWDTAYLWENAEAALAMFEAAQDLRAEDAARSRKLELDGLTILRAIAKHHYGPYGFLTEGVDWNNHVGQKHHIGQVKYGAIQYTEPFLNNQHIIEPTLFYLDNLATKTKSWRSHGVARHRGELASKPSCSKAALTLPAPIGYWLVACLSDVFSRQRGESPSNIPRSVRALHESVCGGWQR